MSTASKKPGQSSEIIQAVRTIARTAEFEAKVNSIKESVLRKKPSIGPESIVQYQTGTGNSQGVTGVEPPTPEVEERVPESWPDFTGGGSGGGGGTGGGSNTPGSGGPQTNQPSTSGDNQRDLDNQPTQGPLGPNTSNPPIGGSNMKGYGGGGAGATAANRAMVQEAANALAAAGVTLENARDTIRQLQVDNEMLSRGVENVSRAHKNTWGNAVPSESGELNPYYTFGLMGKDVADASITKYLELLGRENAGLPGVEDMPENLDPPVDRSSRPLTTPNPLDWGPADPDAWEQGVYYSVTALSALFVSPFGFPANFPTWGMAANQLTSNFGRNGRLGFTTFNGYSQALCAEGKTHFELRTCNPGGGVSIGWQSKQTGVVGCPSNPTMNPYGSCGSGATVTTQSGTPSPGHPWLPTEQPEITPFNSEPTFEGDYPITNTVTLYFDGDVFKASPFDPSATAQEKEGMSVTQMVGEDGEQYEIGTAVNGGWYVVPVLGGTAVVWRANATVRAVVPSDHLGYWTRRRG